MPLQTKDLYWAAGFLDGDGSFLFSKSGPAVIAAQVNLEPLSKLHELFGGYIQGPTWNGKPNHKPIYRWSCVGATAAGLGMTLFTLMSPVRKEQIKKMVAGFKNSGPQNKFKTHCPKGHEYTEENTRIWGPSRYCISCNQIREKERERYRGSDGKYHRVTSLKKITKQEGTTL